MNTDNRTVSRTSLTGELEFLQKNWDVREEDIFQMMKNGIATAFADDSVKDRIYRRIVKEF